MFSKNIYGSFKINSALGINPQERHGCQRSLYKNNHLYTCPWLRAPWSSSSDSFWELEKNGRRFLSILLKINYHVPQKGSKKERDRLPFASFLRARRFFGEYGTDLADITSLDSVCELQAPHLFSSLVVVYCDWSTCDKAKVKSTRHGDQ